MVNELYDNDKGRIEVFESPFQADPNIARRILQGEAYCIIGGNSDYLMYIGPMALNDIMIRDIVIDHRTLSLKLGIIKMAQ